MTLPYRVVAKVKNNRLWSAILREFPHVKTQSDAAQALGETPSNMASLLNMQYLPRTRGQVWTRVAERIATKLRETPDYLFDPDLYGRRPQPIAVEVGRIPLEAPPLSLTGDPEERMMALERQAQIEAALQHLKPREADVLRRRFGLDGEDEETLRSIGADLHRAAQTVAITEASALRKLRRPALAKALREVQ